jgi:pimeloyl-ACP methyl ester carboxylesterase
MCSIFYRCLIVCLFFNAFALAEPVSIKPASLKLNANYIENTDTSQPFFLILHGTLAWHGMELPSTLQTLLQEEGYGSLAFTLSLGQTDRSGFFDCQQPIISGHGDAQQEIDYWVDYLHQQGYKNIVLVGHSRGGAQMAAYALHKPTDVKQVFLIAPMVWVEADISAEYQQKNSKPLAPLLKDLGRGNLAKLSQQDVLHCKKSAVSAGAFLSYYRRSPEKHTPALISEIKVPARVYLGTEDPLTIAFNKQQAMFISNPKVSLSYIDGADHFFRDLYADELVEDMIDALQ